MKNTGLALLAACVLLLSGTLAFAKTIRSSSAGLQTSEAEVDGSFAFATGPGSFDTGYGLNFGAGYTLGEIDKNLQARVDISYFQFSYDYAFGGGSTGLNYTRVPITVSGRYYLPVMDKLRVFGQAGLETSFDHSDYYSGGNKQSKTELNLGISPGAGVEFFVNRHISIFALGRAHLISDSYFSMQFGIASYF